MRVLLSGYYGFGNVGDEAVLDAIVNGFRRHDQALQITVLSASPQMTAHFYNVKAVGRYSWFNILIEMLKADVFVSGGGTLFQDSSSNRSFWYYISQVLLAKILFKKVMVFAQGFGPLTGRINRQIAALALKRVNVITVRDNESKKKMAEIGVKPDKIRVTADPTFLLSNPSTLEGRKVLALEGVATNKPLLGVSVRSLPKRQGVELPFYRALAEMLDSFVEKNGHQVVFLLLHCPEDMRETSKVINFMSHKSNVVFKICSPQEMLSVISQCDFLIGMRLHSLIFAVKSIVPAFGLSYDPNVKSFMDSVGSSCLSVDEVLDPTRLEKTVEAQFAIREASKKLLEKV
ncbi:MAG: polysaccharide pyruvyl transferase CsaB, partial [Candidatus Margulisbacteria bacterium]|nr:polysaccharide pyruvyl transferase CsaB [Candidatus Margulisiibacteriota bacterium]